MDLILSVTSHGFQKARTLLVVLSALKVTLTSSADSRVGRFAGKVGVRGNHKRVNKEDKEFMFGVTHRHSDVYILAATAASN